MKITARAGLNKTKNRYHEYPKLKHYDRNVDLRNLSNEELFFLAKAVNRILKDRDTGAYAVDESSAKVRLEELKKVFK